MVKQVQFNYLLISVIKGDFMNTIEIAPSWELLNKSGEDTKNLDPRNTEQWAEFYKLLNWNVSTEVVDKVAD